MMVEAQVTIGGPRAAIWAAITDIENAGAFIRGIEKIEILERPTFGLVGLRWRETRILFGKPAAVEKQVVEASELGQYSTRAADGGFVFLTTFRIEERGGDTILVSSHETQPQGFAARLQAIPMQLFFKGVIRKAILEDLNDIKKAVEEGRYHAA